jgi:Sulfotransferase family
MAAGVGPLPDGAPETLSWAQLAQFFPHRRIGYHIHPLPEHGLIYVKNPKAGCSTVLAWLDRLHTGDLDREFTNIHKEHRLPTIREVGRRRVVRMLSGEAYRFSFVRDPLRRFESVYWDKLVRSADWRVRAMTMLGITADPDSQVSFEQFLGAVEQQDPVSEMDPHWRPQHVNLLHPLVSYDYVGRLESFDSDLERIREEARLPNIPVAVRNVSAKRGTDSVYDGRPDLVNRVERLFATDFELYGY